MTHEEMLAELEGLYRAHAAGPDDAYTTDEWSDMLGLADAAVRRRLRAAKKAGRLEVVQVVRENLQGRPHRVSAFRILPA